MAGILRSVGVLALGASRNATAKRWFLTQSSHSHSRPGNDIICCGTLSCTVLVHRVALSSSVESSVNAPSWV